MTKAQNTHATNARTPDVNGALMRMAKSVDDLVQTVRKLGIGQDALQGEQSLMREEQIKMREEQIKMREEQIKMREEQIKMGEGQIKMGEEQIKTRQELAEAMNRIDAAVDSINIAAGGLQRRAGRNLENTMAGVFRYCLGLKDVKPESIKLRQKFALNGEKYEVDLMMHNHKTYLFEVSFYVDSDKAQKVCERARAVARHLRIPAEKVEKVVISLDKSFDAIHSAKEYGLILIP